MGLLARLLEPPPEPVTIVYGGPSHDATRRQLGAGSGTEELVHQTNLQRLAIRATEIKAEEAMESYARLEMDASTEFRGLVTDLSELSANAPSERTRRLIDQFNEHSIQRTGNTFDKYLRIAGGNQAQIIDRSVLPDRE